MDESNFSDLELTGTKRKKSFSNVVKCQCQSSKLIRRNYLAMHSVLALNPGS